MGRNEPPFIYDPPSRRAPSVPEAPFNPKQYEQASWAPSPQRPKKKGPLVNFNQHPDSFGLIANGRSNFKSMSPRTKQKVKYTRWVQLGLRILTLIGALGILFCVICIKGTTLTLAWMIRVPPCVSIIHCIYGIYHLLRSANARTPGSSASYMLFAAVLDAGLIPLYVFTAIVSDVEHESKAYGWDTLFGTKEAAEYIIHATFLACSTVGGLHLISLGLDLYLAVIFRKISKLPPDMNPLEDNLTSRARKRNKSELMEKHLSHDTTASANANRQSMAQDPLVSTRTVPFMHTRTDSASTLSSSEFRGTDSPRSSYYSAKTHVQSRSELPSQQMLYHDQATRSRTNIARTPAQKRSSTLSRPQSVVFDTAPVTDQSQLEVSDPRQRDPSGVSSLSDGNWCAYPSSPPSPETYPVDAPGGLASVANRAGTPMIPDVDDSQWDNSGIQHRGDTVIRHRGEYAALDSCDHDDEENRPGRPLTETIHIFEHDLGDNQLGYPLEEANEQTRYPTLNPLEMNPPTPQPPESSISSQQSKNSLRRIALADIPNPPSGRSTPSKGSKPRTYGELEKTAVAPAQRVGSLRGKNAQANDTEKKTKTRWRRKTGNYESLNIHDDESNSENDGPADRENGDRKGRVVSNTGIDLGTGLGSSPAGYGSYIAGLGVGRRREVSGKVAEEGRGGSSLGSENPDSASKAKRLSKQGEYRSAGWARFKGL